MYLSSLNSLIVIIMIGSLLLLSFLLFANPQQANKKANICLSFSFLLWASFWFEELMVLIHVNSINPYFYIFLHFAQFLTPLFIYLSVVYFSNPDYKFNKNGWRHLVLPIIYLGLLFFQFYNNDVENIKWILLSLLYCELLFYIGYSFVKIRRHQKNIAMFCSDTSEVDLGWLEYIIYALLFVVGLILFYNIFLDFADPNLFINFILLLVVYFVAYHSLKQKEIYPVNKKQRSELISINKESSSSGVKRKIISDENLEILKQDLNELMLIEKPYLDSELNLIKMSDLLEITPHQLSYVINTGFNENFFEFVNKYRVEKAKELLVASDKENLTILAIAFESGFNSKTSFNTTFKKITDQTPSGFKKISSNL